MNSELMSDEKIAPIRILVIANALDDFKPTLDMLNDKSRFSLSLAPPENFTEFLTKNSFDSILIFDFNNSLNGSLKKYIEYSRDFPTVVISDSFNKKNKTDALKYGIQEYLVKDQFDEKTLKRTIHYAIDRKNMERMLIDRNYLDSLLNYANSPIVVWNNEFKITRFNHSFEHLTGLEENSIIGRDLSVLFPEDKKDYAMKQIERTLEGELLESVELPILDINENIRTILWSSAKIYGPDKKTVVAIIAQGQDITERKIAEEKMQASELRYRRLFESAKDGILILDFDTGLIVDVNPFLIDLLGYSYEDLTKKHIWDIGIFKDVVASKEAFLELQKKTLVRYEDLPLRTKNGKDIDAEFVSNVYLVDGTKVIQCNIRDITERKITEEKMKKTIEEKEILLKEVHHRVKNNLQMISSLLHLQSFLADPKTASILNDSQNRVKSISLVHEILYKSKDFTNISSKKYFEELINRLIRTYPTNYISIETDIEDTPLQINTAITCGLLMNELIINSLKHAFPVGEGKIYIYFNHEEGNNELTIKDSGIGMPKDFDLDKSKSLGLKIVKMLAEQLDGKIDIVSDKGTLSKITFPNK